MLFISNILLNHFTNSAVSENTAKLAAQSKLITNAVICYKNNIGFVQGKCSGVAYFVRFLTMQFPGQVNTKHR